MDDPSDLTCNLHTGRLPVDLVALILRKAFSIRELHPQTLKQLIQVSCHLHAVLSPAKGMHWL